jgi:GT2 family glycosyltransferase
LALHPVNGPPSFATQELDLTEGHCAANLLAADNLLFTLIFRGRAIERVWLPSPAAGGSDLVYALLGRIGARVRARERLLERIGDRLGDPRRPLRPIDCTVVVCTHGRPEFLPDLLRSLAALEPAPVEVIIVDNAPGERDSRDLVEAAGFRYVRENAKGLDHARRAGLLAAKGEFVAFTDDDCIPSRAWLAALPDLFSDLGVGAVTGPGFAYEIASAPQVRFEEADGFSRGLRSRSFDFRNTDPVSAGRAGAGANMIFRRELLLSLGDPFPVELDAGTPTRSGGDLTALARAMSSGHRVVYDPRVHVRHRHRRDARSLHDTFFGYGVGMSSALVKLLVEDREVEALAAWTWLIRQYVRRLAARARGRGDSVDVRVGWDYLRGGMAGPAALLRSRRAEGLPLVPRRAGGNTERAPEPVITKSPHCPASQSTNFAPCSVEVSVIIPTRDRPEALRRSLCHLAAQEDCGALEVIIVDDSTSPFHANGLDSTVLRVERMSTGGIGPAAARNVGARSARGRLLLFLDDDLMPLPGLVSAHRCRHDEQTGRVIIGYSKPRPAQETLVAQAMRLWWEEYFARKSRSLRMTFADVLTGNMSIARDVFERLGGFDEAMGALRREDWEWGVRVLGANVEVVYAPEAIAYHEYRATTRGGLASAFREGAGDARLVEKHPHVASYLREPFRLKSVIRHPASGLGALALRRGEVRAALIPVLNGLEAAKARRRWSRLYGLAISGAWEAGFRSQGASRPPTPALRVELASSAPIAPVGAEIPTLEVELLGRPVLSIRPAGLAWHPDIADQLVDALPWKAWEEAIALDAPAERSVRRLDDVAVVSSRGGLARAGVADLRAAGAGLVLTAGDWRSINRAIEAADRPIIALPVAGLTPPVGWLGLQRIAFDSPRVSLCLGVGLTGRVLTPPLRLVSNRRRRAFDRLGQAPHCVLVRRDSLLAAGGLEAAFPKFGFQAQILRLIEHCLSMDGLVAYQEASWTGEPALRSIGVQEERLRALGLGFLSTRALVERGGVEETLNLLRQSVGPPLGRLRSAPSPQSVKTEVGRGAFFAAGAARAVLMGRSGTSSPRW